MKFEYLMASKTPMFLCSFGKDSSCILHALSRWLDKVTVVFIDCGGLYPDIVEWARSEGAKMPNFVYMEPENDIWKDIRAKGFPVDMEIAELGQFGAVLGADEVAQRHKIRPWTDCMNERVWQPMMRLVNYLKPDLLITGERGKDRPCGAWPEVVGHGVRMERPIFDWTDQEVWDYIDQNKILLPKTFQGRQVDRRDCWLCLGGHDLTPQRIRELRDEWPDLYHKLFIEEGFGEVVPAMLHQIKQKGDIWEGIQQVLEG